MARYVDDVTGNLDQRIAGFGDELRAMANFGGRSADQAGDLARRTGRSLGEFATSCATTAKSAAGFAGTRRLDAGIEREQIGLEGDLVDPRR